MGGVEDFTTKFEVKKLFFFNFWSCLQSHQCHTRSTVSLILNQFLTFDSICNSVVRIFCTLAPSKWCEAKTVDSESFCLCRPALAWTVSRQLKCSVWEMILL